MPRGIVTRRGLLHLCLWGAVIMFTIGDLLQVPLLLIPFAVLMAAAVALAVVDSLAPFRRWNAEPPVLTRPVAVGWTGQFMDGNELVTVTVTKIYDDYADLTMPDGTVAFTPLIALFNAKPPVPADQRVKSPAAGTCRHTSHVVIHTVQGTIRTLCEGCGKDVTEIIRALAGVCDHDLEPTAVVRVGTDEQVFRCTICESRGTLAEMCPPGDWRVELEPGYAVVRTGNVAVRFPIRPPKGRWRIDVIYLDHRSNCAVPHYLPGKATSPVTPVPKGCRELAQIVVPGEMTGAKPYFPNYTPSAPPTGKPAAG